VSLIKTSNYLRTRKGADRQTDRQTAYWPPVSVGFKFYGSGLGLGLGLGLGFNL
jgi:hypothetical protein